MLGTPEVFLLTDSTRETRNGEHTVASSKEFMYKLFFAQRLGVDVVSNFVISELTVGSGYTWLLSLLHLSKSPFLDPYLEYCFTVHRTGRGPMSLDKSFNLIMA